MRMLWIILALAIPFATASAQTAHSLDQVPALLKTPEAKRNVEEQLQGKAPPDRLGLHLPDALSAQQITALLLPADDKAKLNSVGAKPLAGQADRYVALVCTGGDIPKSTDDTPCSMPIGDQTAQKLRVHLGIIEAKPGAPPHLVAKPLEVNGMVDWRKTTLPSAPDMLEDAKSDEIPPDSYSGFDLAPYRIAADQPAFGLRGEWQTMYSGGNADWTALYLFAVVDGALRQVLTVPMSSYQNIAGDWHKDGTRDHDITDAGNLLIVTPRVTDGHFDLLLKRRGGKQEQQYRWSAAAQAYRAVGK